MEQRTFHDEPPWTTCELPYTGTDIAAARAPSSGRRWLPRTVLPQLSPAAAAELAEQLLSFREDFLAVRRDRSTWLVVQRLERTTLLEHADPQPGATRHSPCGSGWAPRDGAYASPWRGVSSAAERHRRGKLRSRCWSPTPHRRSCSRTGPNERSARAGGSRRKRRGLLAETAATPLPDLLLPAWRAGVRRASARAACAEGCCPRATERRRAGCARASDRGGSTSARAR